MIPQIDANAFVKFQIVEPKNRLIIFSIFTNDSNIEIVSKKAMYSRSFRGLFF